MNSRSNERHKVDTMWKDYLETRSVIARDLIVSAYKPLVERIAREIMLKKPSNFEKDDLVQAGMIGLVTAVERFDPTKGAKFSTYAPLRVRGSIYDEINSMDWTPRLVRESIKAVIRAQELHYKKSSTTPTDEELSKIIYDHFGKDLSPEKVSLARQQYNRTYIHAIDHAATISHEEKEVSKSRHLFIEDFNSESITDEDIREIIRQKCSSLERHVLYGIFFEEKSMKKLAQEFDMSLSKISQAKKDGIAKVKTSIQEYVTELRES